MVFAGDDAPERETRTFGEQEIIPCDTLSLRDQRAVVFHLLYAVDVFDYQVSFEAVVDNFCRGFLCEIKPDGHIYQKARTIVEQRDLIDDHIKPLLHNWRFDRIGTCTRLILRIALYELMTTDLDVSVVMNEAIELAKCFAEVDAHKFINGVLDEWIKVKQASEPSDTEGSSQA